MEEKRFALLIDSDNISYRYIKYIMDEISRYGNVTYKRIYGDWTRSEASSWKELLLENSIIPMQQYSYTTGKNATDSAMIIDAMDILYSEKVEGFCLASSDSDFTRLAARLRESGMMVVGMGEKKTPGPFRSACDKFTYLDVLADLDRSDDAVEPAGEPEATIDIKVIETTVIKIITENDNSGRDTGIGELGSRLNKQYPDFDVRNYGYSKLSIFLEKFDFLSTRKNGNTILVSLKDSETKMENVENEIIAIIRASGSGGLTLGDLSNKLRQRISNFNLRDYGYTKFSKFVQDQPKLRVSGSGKNQRVVLDQK